MRLENLLLQCTFALAIGGLIFTQPAQAQESLPTTTPLPPTTTQEHLVNPVGLSESPRTGWHTDFIGSWRGDFDLSLGIKFWPTKFALRNLIFGGTVDLLPGLRARLGLRRREGGWATWGLDTDEAYLEAYDQFRAPTWNAGANLRIGRVRYLRFPYPDAIAQFDQVPGIGDLYGDEQTAYRSLVLQAEFALNSGWGVHGGLLAQGLPGDPTVLARLMEAYLFYRSDFGHGWHFETRLGDLAVRRAPLGQAGQPGLDVYVGKQVGEFHVGLLYEQKRTEPEFLGLMVQFRPGDVTRALGRIMFDYARRPEGFSVQLPLWHGRLNPSRFVHPGDTLVGEVRAVRVRTIWQGSFSRNQYEHRLASWGETEDPKLRCVVVEEPWYTQSEAIISPHLVPDARWERDRNSPGQFVQRVTYRFYRAR